MSSVLNGSQTSSWGWGTTCSSLVLGSLFHGEYDGIWMPPTINFHEPMFLEVPILSNFHKCAQGFLEVLQPNLAVKLQHHVQKGCWQ